MSDDSLFLAMFVVGLLLVLGLIALSIVSPCPHCPSSGRKP